MTLGPITYYLPFYRHFLDYAPNHVSKSFQKISKDKVYSYQDWALAEKEVVDTYCKDKVFMDYKWLSVNNEIVQPWLLLEFNFHSLEDRENIRDLAFRDCKYSFLEVYK